MLIWPPLESIQKNLCKNDRVLPLPLPLREKINYMAGEGEHSCTKKKSSREKRGNGHTHILASIACNKLVESKSRSHCFKEAQEKRSIFPWCSSSIFCIIKLCECCSVVAIDLLVYSCVKFRAASPRRGSHGSISVCVLHKVSKQAAKWDGWKCQGAAD